MARILVTVMPFAGHIAPITGLVAGLIRRGHTVTVYTGSRYVQRFADLGAHTVPWVHAPDFDENDLRATFPVLPRNPNRWSLFANIEHIFVRSAAGQVQDLREEYSKNPWDAMIGDQLCLGLALTGEIIGCPWASVAIVPTFLFSKDLPPGGLALHPGRGPVGRARDRILRFLVRLISTPMQHVFNETRAAVGLAASTQPLDEAWYSPYLVAATGVPAIEYPRTDLHPWVHFVGALPAAPTSTTVDMPAWWPSVQSTTRTVVHVTQGTLNTDPHDLLEPAIEALGGTDALLVVSTGKASPVLPFTVPSNTRVAAFVPYLELLPRVDVMVTNGGWGGVLAALSHGIPLIVAGGDLDKPEIAARVAASGAGIDLRTGHPSARKIREAYRRISSDARFRKRALEIAAELQEHDGPEEIVDLLEEVMATGSRVDRRELNPWHHERP